MSCVLLQDVTKHFRVLNRREDLVGAFRDLFSRDYRTVKAVDGVSLSIERGELVGFIGPNGAGKSTVIKMLTGVLEPTSGTVAVEGYVPSRERRKYVRNIGIVFGQRTQLWWDLAVIESFKLLREIYRIDAAVYARNMGLFDELVKLSELYNVPVRSLSLGQRMLCDIAASLLHEPRVVFLDEPTIGLDVEVRSKVRTIVRELNERKRTTVLLTSHDVADIESLAQRIVLIDKGKLLYDGPTERFIRMFGTWRTLRLDVHALPKADIPLLRREIEESFEGDDLKVGDAVSGWVAVSFDQDRVPLLDLLRPVLGRYQIRDIKVEEIEMEEVIRRVYRGGVK